MTFAAMSNLVRAGLAWHPAIGAPAEGLYFVSATYPLKEAPEAFQAYEANPGGVLRIVISN